MKKVFISFCCQDQKLVERFLEFLQLGIGMERKNISCTFYPEMLETGSRFIEKIRTQLKECDTVISIITDEYLKSKFCLMEMGAAWALSKNYFPLVLVPYEMLNGTPLSGMQMRRLDSQTDLSVVYDELHRCGVLEEYQTAEFNKRVVVFIKEVSEYFAGKELYDE